MRPALLCGALLLLNLLIGCLALTIGEKTTVIPSVGEQLTHLKAAFDSGALTDAEYTSQKMALLNKSTELNESPTQLATFETDSAE